MIVQKCFWDKWTEIEFHFAFFTNVRVVFFQVFLLLEQVPEVPVSQKMLCKPQSSSIQCILNLPLPPPLPSSLLAGVCWEVSTVEAWVWEALPWFTAIACASAAMRRGYHLSACHTVRCSLTLSLSRFLHIFCPSLSLPSLNPLSRFLSSFHSFSSYVYMVTAAAWGYQFIKERQRCAAISDKTRLTLENETWKRLTEKVCKHLAGFFFCFV